MKLWQKGFNIHKKVEEFTIGKDIELDMLLAEFDVLGSIAHAKMLQSVGLLVESEFQSLHKELKNIFRDIKNGDFKIEKGIEDIHSQIELILTRRLGTAGKKIHTGRSRNDQVLLDIRLFARSEIQKLVTEVKALFDQLILLSAQNKDALLPGYTHLQIAMPSSFGLWFAAYAESLVDDLIFLQAAYQITNKNPLGSAAGYGSSLPLNRHLTTELLGFETLNYNVIYAQMGRGKTERIVSSAIASLASTLSKLAMDVCLYMNQNLGFISFPDELTTGSSIMPHKKNPDVFELIRAKCNKLQAMPNEIMLITGNLPSGYHRDLQITKESFLPAFREIGNCLKMAAYMLKHIIIKREILEDDQYRHIFCTAATDQLVLKGVPFREAYQKISREIEQGKFKKPTKIKYTHEGSIGNLCNDNIQAEMDKVIQRFKFEKVEKALQNLFDGGG